GIERRINRASLSEICHVIPRRGSHKVESRPTWDSVRRRLQELEDAGLIIQQQNLVFELPMAMQDKSVQMRMTRGRHDDDTVSATPAKRLQHNGSNGVGDTMMTRVIIPDDDTTSPVTIKTPLPPLREDEEMPLAWKGGVSPSTRNIAMNLDWMPDNNTLDMYLQGKSANGRTITKADITSRIGKWRENANASGKAMTSNQWTLRLVNYVAACIAKGDAPVSQQQPSNDPLSFTEENRPTHGPYALFKPEPPKQVIDDEGRRRVDEFRRQLFGERVAQ
ncbi:MAG TPA: hypothetical protein PLG48_07345, partial [Candidatus Avimonas sp.]|nr:hypothetical protein [Candidatus Avimonas sp.]